MRKENDYLFGYELFRVFVHFFDISKSLNEDNVDRYNHVITSIFLLACLTLTILYDYFEETVICWTPPQFKDSWVQYTRKICWVSNNYFASMSEKDLATADMQEVVYYQWTPYILAMQTALFSLPFMFWKESNRTCGVNMNGIARTAKDLEYESPENRARGIRSISKHIDRYLIHYKSFKTGLCSSLTAELAGFGFLCGKRYGNYLTMRYLFSKLMYIGNVCLQLYLLNKFLGTDYYIYGVEALKDIANNGTYRECSRFPRIGLCDFEIRTLSNNLEHYVVQCAMPVNIFNEKIFLLIWFWLWIIGIVNIASTLSWIQTMFASDQRDFFKDHLHTLDIYDRTKDKKKLNSFINNYLRQDGHFVIRMLELNSSDMVTTDVIGALWIRYNQYHKQDESLLYDV